MHYIYAPILFTTLLALSGCGEIHADAHERCVAMAEDAKVIMIARQYGEPKSKVIHLAEGKVSRERWVEEAFEERLEDDRFKPLAVNDFTHAKYMECYETFRKPWF